MGRGLRTHRGGGTVSIYASTFSAGYPDDEDSVGVVLIRDNADNLYPNPATFRRGAIGGAEIPGWCVPGHDDADDDEPGGWYRLGGLSMRTLCRSSLTRPQLWVDQDYLLDEAAAQALRDDLTRWLDKTKTRPVRA